MSSDHPRVKIYTKRWCLYCLAAKRLLRRLQLPFEEIPIDSDPGLRARVSASAGGWPTVPMIFVGESFLGGFRELRAARRRRLLKPLSAVDEG